MNTPIQLTVLSGTVTSCPRTTQALATAIAAAQRVLLPVDVSFFIAGPNEPTVEQRSLVWVKTDAATEVIVGLYRWSPLYSAWLRNHWEFIGGVPPTYERRLFFGTLNQLETHDGGESGTVTNTTGPFWEVDSTKADKWPIGVGTEVVTVNTTAQVFDDAVPGDPAAVGVYFIKPTGRLFDRGN
jgi:hypothetical protein